MPRRRRAAIGRSTPNTQSHRNARGNETHEERALRLQRVSQGMAGHRATQTETQRAARQLNDRERRARDRARRTSEQRALQSQSDAARTVRARAAETDEERTQRVVAARDAVVNIRRRQTINLNHVACAYDPSVDYHSHPCVVIGPMEKKCRHCDAFKFQNETPGMCCANGKVKLPLLLPPPEPLATLLSGNTPDSKHFLLNIRKYNSCFQMTSFGATNIVRGNYMPTFKIQGQIYHQAGSLLPLPDEEHKFLQIYFMGDTNQEIDQRVRFNAGTKREIVSALQELLDQNNELVRLFRTALDRMPRDDARIVIRADKTPAGQHQRRYNAPHIDEVAIVIVGEDFDARDIVLHGRNDRLERIAETHRSYDALQYPIIFCRGEDGYHFNIKMINPATGDCFSQNTYMQYCFIT